MILMLQSFDIIANENARYKRNELECIINTCQCTDRSDLKVLTIIELKCFMCFVFLFQKHIS